MILKPRYLGLAASVVILSASAASGSTLPPVFNLVLLQHNQQVLQKTDPGNYQLFGATGSSFNLSSPTVHSSLSGELAQGNESANTEVQYFFEVNGPAGSPPPTTAIPMLITGLLHYAYAGPITAPGEPTTIFWSALASVSANSYDDNGPVDSAYLDFGCVGTQLTCDNSNGAPNGDLLFTLHLNVRAGFLNVVSINAGTAFTQSAPVATVGLSAQFTSVDALADPVIGFDPLFDATGYELALSNGVGNQANTAAPEPGSFGLAGIVCGGVLLWRRRRG